MRLLNTTTLEFREFYDSQIPKYSILSHRWGDDEVTLQDFEAGKQRSRTGYAKVERCCALAKLQRFDWVWIDTCCIDNRSSAELSEAINSMYRWYHNASECYAYLADVTCVNQGLEQERFRKEFRESNWFTRGWTLQELLAPYRVLFFNWNWTYIGIIHSDGGYELATDISSITGIEIDYLMKRSALREACVAVKMSWASKRQTSRIEDMAYCLLGLFNINMPLLYGEGWKAFYRLQLEIIQQSADESIFAWIVGPLAGVVLHRGGALFAPRPAYFADSGTIDRLYRYRRPYFMTNRGLAVDVPCSDLDQAGDIVALRLNCYDRVRGESKHTNEKYPIIIALRQAHDDGYTYVRVELYRWHQAETAVSVYGKAAKRPSAGKLEPTERIYVPSLLGR